jgi:hypothetical protein
MIPNPNYDPRHRHTIRIKDFDYSQPGAYFITIISHARECLFGEIQAGIMNLSPAGQIADRNWRTIPDHFTHVELGTFTIMPNHIHGILIINDDVRGTISTEDSCKGTISAMDTESCKGTIYRALTPCMS